MKKSLTIGLLFSLVTLVWMERPSAAVPPVGVRVWTYTMIVKIKMGDFESIVSSDLPKNLKLSQALDAMGDNGWELAAVEKEPLPRDSSTTTYYFKRPAK